ncbi:MAG: NADH-quinone oxidoreductase subunit C [Acidobacteriia bacterium]|nr:NADH-quinone oxidoreductase subunit C [Terriglobia bacterium]
MADTETITRELQGANLGLTAIEQVTAREVRITGGRDLIVPVAEWLRDRYQARPEMIWAEDTRAEEGSFTLRYLFEVEGADAFILLSVSVPAGDRTFPSLATRWYLASRFEREIHDLFGLVPLEHPDLRRLPLHQFWPADFHPLLKDSSPPSRFIDDGSPFPFRRVEGEGIYEITVGPVHAGIIEPGHFRFSVEGETIINLESRFYFVHKGIEKLFETLPWERGVELAERISGDSSVAHAMAFCQAVEAIAGTTLPQRAAWLRVVVLELERLYNHIADVGAICTDTGFAFANAHAMRLREDLLRLNDRLFAHRLLRGVLTPGGVLKDLNDVQRAEAQAVLFRVLKDFEEIVEIARTNALVMDRLIGTGLLTRRTAQEMQVVGMVARASGIDADVRRDHPFAAYPQLEVRVAVRAEGDVWARMMVRVEEVRESVRLIEEALQKLPEGKLCEAVAGEGIEGGALGLVEGWRGPVAHWVVGARRASPSRVKIKDPSFANWPALNYAILRNIVPDFPLINKSFNLSYAGNDL